MNYKLLNQLTSNMQILNYISKGLHLKTINMALFKLMVPSAKYERELIKERINAGLQSARSRGSTGGRPKVTLRKQHSTC